MHHAERALTVSVANGYVGKLFDPGVFREPVVVNRVKDGQQTPLFHYEEHSPQGFAWGKDAAGAADLALSILIDFVGDEEVARFLYQKFKAAFVVHFQDEWEISDEALLGWVGTHFMQGKSAGACLSDADVTRIIANFRSSTSSEYVLSGADNATKLVQACLESNLQIAALPLSCPDEQYFEVRVLSDQATGVLSPWSLEYHETYSILPAEELAASQK